MIYSPILDRYFKLEGTSPENSLLLRISFSIINKLPSSCGSSPVKKLSCSLSHRRFCNCFIKGEIEDVNLFSPKWMFFNSVIVKRDSGIVPVRKFLFNFKTCKAFILPMLSGIVPFMEVPTIVKRFIFVTLNNCGGMVPTKDESPKTKFFNAGSRPRDDGIVPCIKS